MFGIIICLINNVREGDLDFANEIDDLVGRLRDRALQLEDADWSDHMPYIRPKAFRSAATDMSKRNGWPRLR